MKRKIQDIQDLSLKIRSCALTFLGFEYKILSIFVFVIVAILMFFDFFLAISFILGSFFSCLAGNFGMRIATKSNAKTAEAARKNLQEALKVSFSAGFCAALFSLLLGLFGILLLYFLFKNVNILFGYGFGASFVALFMRVGGGIFTKAADMAADLVGKVETGIEEDDPRNPAVIADLTGDNVGDVAGMGSDLFESYVQSIIAAIAIAAVAAVAYPLKISIIGIFAVIVSSFFVRGKPHKALLNSFVIATLIILIFSFFLFPKNIFYCIFSGLVAGLIIGATTVYYTTGRKKPVREIARAAEKGAAFDVLEGLANGMFSAFLPVVVVSAAILASYSFAGLYGIAISAVGMFSILGIVLAADFYHPIVDNAAGISEFCKLKKARTRAEQLDELGNTTAAIGKGFAISSAALTATALLVSYVAIAKISIIDLLNVKSISVLFLGAMIPFFFSALAIKAVSDTSEKIVEETRKQLKKIFKKKAKPNYEKCIKIATSFSLRKMILPGILTIFFPLAIGFFLGKTALATFLAGSIATAFVLAIFMANAGTSLDNAKKYIETRERKTETHKATVIGDTIGDPLKDTAGPSLNILIKLMCIVAIIFVLIW